MLDSHFRSTYQKVFVEPLLSIAWISNRSPVTITLLSCLFGLAAAPLIASQLNILAILSLIISGYLDTLDGSLARLQKTTSHTGAVLDIISDRLVEFSVILGLFLIHPLERGLPCILMLGSVLLCITSFLVVGIFSENSSEKSFHYSPGLMERAEAFLLWGAMILFPFCFSFLAYLFTALVLYTALYRLKQFFRSVKRDLQNFTTRGRL